MQSSENNEHDARGDIGEQGEQGEHGEQGEQGEIGVQGERGMRGERGPHGDHGQSGDIGPSGIPGEIGEQGVPGVPGERGKQGDPGVKVEKESIHRWRWTALLIWIVIFTLAVSYSINNQRSARHYNCERISKAFIAVVQPLDNKVGSPGTPGYSYYKEHPDELKAARAQNKQIIASVNPSTCH